MDLGFTSGLADLLEEQRRKRELEALKQQEPAATSPVLTPEVSTNGAQTAAPAGDSVAGVSGQASHGNRQDGPVAAYPGVLQRQGGNTGSFPAKGIGYGMSAAAEDVNQLEQSYVAAGRANAAPMQRPDTSLPVGVAAPGGNQAQELASMAPKAMDSPMAMPEGRQVAEESAVGGIGAALAKAGVTPPDVAAPAAPADPLAPKPKLTARQRAEAEIPAVDDMKGWQKVLLVMGAGLAGGLSKDASLGAKLAAMTPQNRRERLVKERIKEIQEQDKLDLETRQTEAQIAATEKGTVRADKQLDLTAKEQEFSQNLRLANLDIDVRRLRLDEDVRRMDAETKAAAVKAREAYNAQVLELRKQALERGVQLQAGAQLVDPQTGQIITENPYQPQVTTSTDTKTVTDPKGNTFTEKNEKTETKTRGGGQDATTRAGGNVSPERKAEIDAYAKYLAAGGKWKKDIWMTAGKPAAPIAEME